MNSQLPEICCLPLLLIAALPLLGPQEEVSQPKRCWTVDTANSRLIAHVEPAGLFSRMLHAHHLVPADWGGRVCFDPTQPAAVDLEITVQPDRFEDHQEALSAEDRQKVERQVSGPEVLNASAYPAIRYRARRVSIAESNPQRLVGTLHGELSLHGQTHSLEVPVTVEWNDRQLRAAGRVQFKQSDFGIEPYSRFLGSVSVEDRVSVEFAIDAVAESR